MELVVLCTGFNGCPFLLSVMKKFLFTETTMMGLAYNPNKAGPYVWAKKYWWP